MYHCYNFAKGSQTNFIEVILVCEEAMIGDEKDETGQLIRQSLNTTLPPYIVVAKKRKGELEWEFELTGLEVSSEAYPSLHIYYTDQEEI